MFTTDTPLQRFFALQAFICLLQFVDEDYYECTPVPLWQRAQPILDYDTFLEREDDDVLVLVSRSRIPAKVSG